MTKIPSAVAVVFLFFVVSAKAVEIRLLGTQVFSTKLKFAGTQVGGLSGLARSADGSLWAVSDDRQTPRLYELEMGFNAKNFTAKVKSVLKLKVGKSRVLDLEGIAPLPWGNFLLSSEGDLNHKPRVSPELLDIKRDASIATTFEIPNDFLPEKSGKQKTGIRNNQGFEGLSASPSGQKWMAAAEGALLQDPPNTLRLVEYAMPEAWVLRPKRQFFYEPRREDGDLQGGITEVLWIADDKIWILERFVNLKKKFRLRLSEVVLPEPNKESTKDFLKPRWSVELNSILNDPDLVQNYEGILLGPPLASGEKTLVLVSDDNFSSNLQTRFLFLSFKE